MAKFTKLEQKTLDDAIAATEAGSYIYASEDLYQPLVEAGLVEVNPEIVNEAGEIAVRAILSAKQTQTEEKKGVVKMSFEIESNIPIPVGASRRGGAREAKYPFDKLEVGQSFFVAPSEKHPEPWKSYASTISGATKRYDVPDIDEATGIQKTKKTRNPKTGEVNENAPATKHTRIFKIVEAEKDGVKGGRVFRIQ